MVTEAPRATCLAKRGITKLRWPTVSSSAADTTSSAQEDKWKASEQCTHGMIPTEGTAAQTKPGNNNAAASRMDDAALAQTAKAPQRKNPFPSRTRREICPSPSAWNPPPTASLSLSPPKKNKLKAEPAWPKVNHPAGTFHFLAHHPLSTHGTGHGTVTSRGSSAASSFTARRRAVPSAHEKERKKRKGRGRRVRHDDQETAFFVEASANQFHRHGFSVFRKGLRKSTRPFPPQPVPSVKS